jgi:hypothetical protein
MPILEQLRDREPSLGFRAKVRVAAALVAAGKRLADISPDTVSPIKDAVALISPKNRIAVKNAAWHDVGAKPRRNLGKHDIEIVRIEHDDDKVEVFARAWDSKTGEQVGFGADGTVDIERFVFVNPPVLVPDGTKRLVKDMDGKDMLLDNFKEDVAGALDLSLADAIRLTGKHGAGKIVAGKEGRTVYTIYPEAGGGGANVTGDAMMNCGYEQNWAATYGHAGTSVPNGMSYLQIDFGLSLTASPNYWSLYRGGLTFDASAIGPGKEVTGIQLSLYGLGRDSYGSFIPSWNFTSFAPSANNDFVASDFNISHFGTVGLQTVDAAFNDFTTTGYNTLTGNATAIALFNTTGVNGYGLRISPDINNANPGWYYNIGAFVGFRVKSADATGTSQDPKLTVEATAGATYNGMAFMKPRNR